MNKQSKLKSIDKDQYISELEDQLQHTLQLSQQRYDFLLYENSRLLNQQKGIKEQTTELKANLKKIKSSKFFKIWQSFCKLREAVIILLK